MSVPILEIKNLNKIFDQDIFKKKQEVVRDLSCHFDTGKCTGFMGHNGAGKTTTIKTVFGLLHPTSGEILFKGRPIELEDKRFIGYMPEVNKLPASLSCEEVLLYHLRIYKPQQIPASSYKDAIESTLREVGLWDHRKKRVGKLSKGMGRRLSWAQANIHEPELVILDEPFSGLDPLGRQLISKLVNDLRQKQTSIILCTHELWSVNEVCDELHILKGGQLSYSSCNPVAGQMPKPLMNFKIEFSKVDLEQLEKWKAQHNLPEWDFSHRVDNLSRLGFTEHEDASRWLEHLLKEGAVIINFAKHSGFDEESLLAHFDGGKP